LKEKRGDDQKTETAVASKDGDKAKESKVVDGVSEQLEKLNVAAESDGVKPQEIQSGGDTATTTASS